MEVLGVFYPSTDSKNFSVRGELIPSEISFLLYSGETAPERPRANRETFLEGDLYFKDGFKKKA
jgi:hypothetical protein